MQIHKRLNALLILPNIKKVVLLNLLRSLGGELCFYLLFNIHLQDNGACQVPKVGYFLVKGHWKSAVKNTVVVFYSFVVISLSYSQFTFASPVTLATSDLSPFSSQYDLSKGYVNEIISQVFDELNLPVEFEYFPHARAVMLAEKGSVNGVFPVHENERTTSEFYLSAAIPAGTSGYLIRSDFKGEFALTKDAASLLKRNELKGVGYLRGTRLPSVIADDKYFSFYPGISASSLLDLLDKKRIDVVFIDKYSVKEALVNERPNLIGKLVFIPKLEESNTFHLAFSKQFPESTHMLKRFDLALKKLMQNGFLTKTLEKYGVYDKAIESENALIIGAPDINAIVHAKEFLEKYDSALSQLNIQWRIMDETVLRRRLLGDFSVNENSFDLVLIGNYGIPIWAKRDTLVPFNQHPADYDIDDIIPAAIQANRVDEQLYGLPFVAETTLTFFRKDLIENANLTMPTALTYRDLISLAESIHSPEKEVYGIGLRTRVGWGQNMALVSTMANTYGATWLDEKMHPQLNKKEWFDAVTTYVHLVRRFGPDNKDDLGWQENQRLFADGNLGFFVDASSLGGALFDERFSRVAPHIGVTYAPIGVQRKGAQWFWSWNFAVPKLSRYTEEAQQLAHWLTSKHFISEVKKARGEYAAPSGTRHSTYTPAYQEALPYAIFEYQALKALTSDTTEQSMVGKQFVPIPEFTAIGYAVGAQINDVIAGKKTVKSALENAQNQTQIILERAGYFSNHN